MTDLYRLLPEEMEKMVIDMGYDRYRANQILMPLYCKFPKSIADIKQLPKELCVIFTGLIFQADNLIQIYFIFGKHTFVFIV